MAIKVIGLDLAKNVFQVHGVDEAGRIALNSVLHGGLEGNEDSLVG